jgi:hypothetical protein
MSKHTPGPWRYSKSEQFGDTRFYISQQEGATYTPNYSDVATLIAETICGEYGRIQEANARLIAAAPELLAALQGLVAVLDRQLNSPHAAERASPLGRARAAIKKATGDTA